MTSSTQPVRRLLDRCHRRFVRSRPGSVLILVVALLVLMALIGTAFMTMAQFDRAAAVQHTFNTEVDLLVEGVINQVKATLTNDLFVNGNFRQNIPQYNTIPSNGGTITGQPNYSYFNGLGLDFGTAIANAGSNVYNVNPGDAWLASRIPDLLQYINADGSGGATPAWPFVTGPLNGATGFDTPYWPNGSRIQYYRPNNAVPNTALQPFAAIIASQPGVPYPGFSNATYLSGGVGPVLAADADGDGIADSGLVKLISLDGITYYAGIRIVDNCAAVNANIAFMPNPTATASTSFSSPATSGIPGDFSPVNVDLANMLDSPGTELGKLLNYRYRGLNRGAVVDDNGKVRSDFGWLGYPVYGGAYSCFFDQQWSQLGRRLQNPGNIVNGSTSNPAIQFQALPVTESMVLAKNFILRDPRTLSAATSSSALEQMLSNTLFYIQGQPLPAVPYAPGDTSNWYKNNFNYNTSSVTNTNPIMPMRALLVARNPVSNFAPAMFRDRQVYTTAAPTDGLGPYQFGDMVTYPATNGHRYVCINPNGAGTAPLMTAYNLDTNYSDPNWAFEPWTTAPTKTSVNTASFQQLWAAYWAVMCETSSVAGGQTVPVPPAFPNSAQPASQRMFRSPVRDETKFAPDPIPQFAGVNPQTLPQLYIRSAIAAINTIDLRSSTPSDTDPTNAIGDVSSRTVQIPIRGTSVNLTVYGIKKQPYITQVYAQNSETVANDWAAIELYNPFPTPIIMTNWHVTAAKRTTPGSVTLTDIAQIPTTTIPANGYVVLIDSSAPPKSVTIQGTPKTVPIPNLAQKGFGNEVVILRPRRADGAYKKSNTANNVFDETTSTGSAPNDLVPIDAYDFTNLPATAAQGQSEEWQYARPSGPGFAWHFVYPGPWNVSKGAAGGPKAPTLSATKATLVTALPAGGTVLTFGTPQTKFLQGNYLDVPLQLNNVDFGGPNKAHAAASPPNVFPYGGFARNGDILQVPFIGSYKIWTGTETAQQIIELNPVTMDSIMATAQDPSNGSNSGQPLGKAGVYSENIGRFCPISKTDTPGIDDFGNNPVLWRYHFATHLFDFLTVLSPQDDYTPNVDPWPADPVYAYTYRYPPTNTNTNNAPTSSSNVSPQVANAGINAGLPSGTFNASGATEETAPVDGLININTAPWRVLAAVPWIPASDASYLTKDALIAQSIVKYRDVDDGSGAKHGHGPFKSIFELNDVLVSGGKLRDILGNTNTADYTVAQGNLSPLQNGPDGVTGDFESRFNLITRVSNLITTRSDSYTAYIVVQGWRNAETPNPQLVVQRRAAVIIDRSAVTPTNRIPTVTNVPMN